MREKLKSIQLSNEQIQQYENKRIQKWKQEKTYSLRNEDAKKPFYCLVMFPYPSGKIHMGHVRNYTIGDAVARFKRLQGYDVLHPMGWDAFGLPAENAAIKNNRPPAEWTYANIDQMRGQLQRMGFSYDWEREIATCAPGYYRWNQYIFIKMFERGWAYKKTAPVNWCSKCETVLANEQVVEGCCWRHEDTPVQQKELSQWFFKITEFAQDLLDGHELLKDKWPNRVLAMQKNWIGRSEGTTAQFPLHADSKEVLGNTFETLKGTSLEIYTTRIDTVFGVTYMAVAPEHPLLDKVESPEYKNKIREFRERVQNMSVMDREDPNKKEGIFTGLYARHPFTNEKLPIFSANFVLGTYGTGAVMSVPAHDERDYDFAKKYGLPIKYVIVPKEGERPAEAAFTEYGVLENSGKYSGLTSEEARKKITEDLKQQGLGDFKVQFRIHDWLLSRQRYWGTPIPIVYCDKCGTLPEKEENLPVRLPENVKFQGSGSPLKDMPDFLNATCPKCQGPARRETDTMDTFVDSSWYWARYISPRDEKQVVDQAWAKKFLPVNQYIGGIEHANMHLLYARYFARVLKTFGIIDIEEPFERLMTQGMVIKDGKKMSKSLGNVVDPDLFLQNQGADTIRLFSMFAAPIEKDLDWSDQGVEGAHRFLKRLYRITEALIQANTGLGLALLPPKAKPETTRGKEILRLTHKTILTVTRDYEEMSYNTGIARLMELTNELYNLFFSEDGEKLQLESTEKETMEYSLGSLLTLLAPVAPFLPLELCEKMGLKEEELRWPVAHESEAAEDEITIVVQVNGKVRDKIQVVAEISKEEALKKAMASEKIQKFTEGKTIKKQIYVPGRLINLVAV